MSSSGNTSDGIAAAALIVFLGFCMRSCYMHDQPIDPVAQRIRAIGNCTLATGQDRTELIKMALDGERERENDDVGRKH